MSCSEDDTSDYDTSDYDCDDHRDVLSGYVLLHRNPRYRSRLIERRTLEYFPKSSFVFVKEIHVSDFVSFSMKMSLTYVQVKIEET